MNHVRIYGDPFGQGRAAHALRGALRYLHDHGLHVSLSLPIAPTDGESAGQRTVAVTDGRRAWDVATSLGSEDVDRVLAAAGTDAVATAPLVVFAGAEQRVDALRAASLEWPQACAVVSAADVDTLEELLNRVRAELRWAGLERRPRACSERQLRPWLALPPADRSCFVHVTTDPFACGTDLVVDMFAARFAEQGTRLRLVLPNLGRARVADLLDRAGAAAARIDVVSAPFSPEHLVDAAVVVQPYRRCQDPEVLVLALASGRAVVASRFRDTAALLAGDEVAFVCGGRNVVRDERDEPDFVPDEEGLYIAWSAALGEACPSPTGARARSHVITELLDRRPAPPPPPVPALGEDRPKIVLEAPLCEASATAEATLATARALLARGDVELLLASRGPLRHDLKWLRARAPELESRVTRNPGRADLWVSAGWPIRADRPDCRRWVVRMDWDYGALPRELAPHVTQEADHVIVHSDRGHHALVAAGRSPRSISTIPHGVDDALWNGATPSSAVTAFKAGKPAVLFCGGGAWRKGMDVFFEATSEARARGHEFVVVIKEMDAERHFGGGQLDGMLDRYEANVDSPRVLRIDRHLSRRELGGVYSACDVLLQPFRGEGFCMPVLEARACGLPVVATAGGATDPLMSSAAASAIAAERRDVAMPGAYTGQPTVLEPDVGSAADQLVQVLTRLDHARAAATREAAAVRAAFSWGDAAAAICALVDDVAGVGSRASAAVEPEVPVPLPAAPPRLTAGSGRRNLQRVVG